MGEAALAALPRRESHRPPLLTPYSCGELTPRRLSRRSTQAIPSTRSSRVILPRPRGRPIPRGLRHIGRAATAALADHPRSRCQWRTAFVKTKGHAPHGAQSIDLRLAGNRHRQRVHCTVSGHQIVDETRDLVSRPTGYVASWVEVASALLLRRRRGLSSGGCWGDIAAVTAVRGSPTAMCLLVLERARC
jgi:hypothetical protein